MTPRLSALAGLVSIMAAKAFGAGKVAVVDMNEGNLEVARQMGADIGILSGRTESPIAVGERIKTVLGPDGPGVVIDCAGFEATMQARPAASRNNPSISSWEVGGCTA